MEFVTVIPEIQEAFPPFFLKNAEYDSNHPEYFNPLPPETMKRLNDAMNFGACPRI